MTSEAEPTRERGLRRELRFWEAIALSIGIMAPGAAMALNGTLPASLVRRAVPLTFDHIYSKDPRISLLFHPRTWNFASTPSDEQEHKSRGFEIENQPLFRRKFTPNSSLYVLLGWLVKRIAGAERKDG